MFENTCIEQLVGRLPSEELMAKLPSFLPVLFDAFGNQNAEVRKVHIQFSFSFLDYYYCSVVEVLLC